MSIWDGFIFGIGLAMGGLAFVSWLFAILTFGACLWVWTRPLRSKIKRWQSAFKGSANRTP